jgi:hypothetical protein
LNLKDALEQALKLTCMWLKLDADPEVVVGTDFDAGLLGETGIDALLAMSVVRVFRRTRVAS